MQTRLLISLMVTLPMLLFGQVNHQKVKINTVNKDISKLQEHGINLDHASYRKGVSLTTILEENQVQKVRNLGFAVQILISDLTRYYQKRAVENPISKTKGLKNTACPSSGNIDPITKYSTPNNFSLGSMGGYFTYQEFKDELDSMASKYPNLITAKSAISSFTTHQGRPIYYVKISDNPNTDEPEPEALYSALHHAREPASLSQLIFYMWHLLENYSSSSEIQYLINESEMYFVPMLNPDGYNINEADQPNGGGLWRKNARDNNSNGVNGIDFNTNNLDGQDGVDLNRNYSYQYGASGVSNDQSDATYLGPSSFSEPETQAMKWFCEQRDFVFALNAHTYGNLLLFPFGWDDNAFSSDHAYFQTFTNYMVRENGYDAIKSSDLYPAAGDSDDWMYDGDLGTKPKIFALTPEIGSDDDGFWPAPNRIIPICKDNVFQNKMNAHLLHNYASIKETDPYRLNSSSGDFNFSLQRLGQTAGTFTVSITPISGISSVGNSQNFTGMNILDTQTGTISYTLDNNLQYNDVIKYVLELDNGQWTKKDTIEKRYGIPNTVAVDPANDLANWSSNPSNSWDITTEDYFSAATSFTDSPNSEYNNNENSSFIYEDTIDLTDATHAMIRFRAKWNIESNYDFVQFMVSIDDGSTWIPQCGKHTVEGSSNQDQGKPLYDGKQTDWVLEEIGLSDYLGQTIRVKFLLNTDLYVTEDGYYVDDFELLLDYPPDLGIEESSEVKFSMYPNPSKRRININFYDKKQKKIEIFTRAGRKIYTNRTNDQLIDLSTAEWSAGLYIVKVAEENGATTRKKLVVAQ